jgi:hypothetical protein
MTKKVCVLFALLLAVVFAAPAMGQAVWIGGDGSTPTSWADVNNWSGNGGSVPPYHWPETITLDNADAGANNTILVDYYYPSPGMIYDNYVGTFYILCSGATGSNLSPAGFTIAAGCTMYANMGGGGTPANGSGGPNYCNFVVAPTGILNLGSTDSHAPLNISGGGTVNWGYEDENPGATLSITGGSTFTEAARTGSSPTPSRETPRQPSSITGAN